MDISDTITQFDDDIDTLESLGARYSQLSEDLHQVEDLRRSYMDDDLATKTLGYLSGRRFIDLGRLSRWRRKLRDEISRVSDELDEEQQAIDHQVHTYLLGNEPEYLSLARLEEDIASSHDAMGAYLHDLDSVIEKGEIDDGYPHSMREKTAGMKERVSNDGARIRDILRIKPDDALSQFIETPDDAFTDLSYHGRSILSEYQMALDSIDDRMSIWVKRVRNEKKFQRRDAFPSAYADESQ